MNDKRVFMNQGEWELLHVLSTYNKFSIDNDDFYAEMKFTVSNVIIPKPRHTLAFAFEKRGTL